MLNIQFKEASAKVFYAVCIKCLVSLKGLFFYFWIFNHCQNNLRLCSDRETYSNRNESSVLFGASCTIEQCRKGIARLGSKQLNGNPPSAVT